MAVARAGLLASLLVVQVSFADVTVRAEVGAGAVVNEPQRTYFVPGPMLAAGVSWGAFEVLDLGGSLAFFFAPRNSSSPLAGPGMMFRVGAHARLRPVLATARYVPFLEAGTAFVQTGSLPRFGLQATAGLLFRVGERLFLGPRLGYEHIFKLERVLEFPTADASVVTLGLAFEFPVVNTVRDLDADGVFDGVDACPAIAGLEAFKGCPPPDADDDGVIDSQDECPAVKGPPPTGCPTIDVDGDGLLEPADRCPKVAGPKALAGCPDTDVDGVPDVDDLCPKVPGKKEERGCPIYKAVVVREDRIEIRQKIFFAFGLATILPKSDFVLGEVVQALKDRPGLCVRIEGHTDNVGAAERNLALSAGRAKAVLDYLVQYGLDRGTLTSAGYGSSQPLESNATPDGRERNRRVEFVISPCKALEKSP